MKNGDTLLISNENKLFLEDIYDNIENYSGIYTCEVTNPLVPDLTLRTGDIKIFKNNDIIPDTTYINESLCLGESITLGGAFFDCTNPNGIIIITDSVLNCPKAYVVEIVCTDCFNDKLLSVPTAFSPNGDNINETFLIPNLHQGLISRDNILTIYDQYGQVVFEQKNYANNWRGNDLSGRALPIGTYYYQFRYENQVTKGMISLIR